MRHRPLGTLTALRSHRRHMTIGARRTALPGAGRWALAEPPTLGGVAAAVLPASSNPSVGWHLTFTRPSAAPSNGRPSVRWLPRPTTRFGGLPMPDRFTRRPQPCRPGPQAAGYVDARSGRPLRR